eukprot:gene8455-4404_t
MCVLTLLIVAIVDAIAFHPDGIQAPDASADPVPTNGGGGSSSKASRIEEFVGKNNNNKTKNNNNNNSTFGSTREIFVAGCGHSGTTLMLRLIGQLSAIFPVQEETCVLCTTGDLSRISAEHRAMHPWERSARRLAELDAAAAGAGARRWVEKTPIHVRYLEKLFLLRLPNPASSASSAHGRYRPENAKKAVAYGASRWANDTSITMEWSNHPQVLVVRYERLVKETSATINKLFNFLGEVYSEEDIMAFYTQSADWNLFSSSSSSSDQAGSTAAGNNNDSSGITNNGSNGGKAIASKVQRPPNEAAGHEQLRSFQVTQPLYDGTGRWLEPPPRGLSPDELEYVMKKCRALLAKLGYD